MSSEWEKLGGRTTPEIVTEGSEKSLTEIAAILAMSELLVDETAAIMHSYEPPKHAERHFGNGLPAFYKRSA